MSKWIITCILALYCLSSSLSSASDQCYTENWWKSFDYPGFSTCKRSNYYLSGLYRNKDDSRKISYIFLIELAKCCQMEDMVKGIPMECVDKPLHFERSNLWEVCPKGYFLNGLERDSDIAHDNRLRNIRQQRCCKPKDSPKEWGQCYDEDITKSFDVIGWSGCKEGYFLTGLYKSNCDWLNCLETMKCCSITPKYVPSEYKFDTRSMTWMDAEKECIKWGGHLATITSKEQNDYISNELKTRNMISGWIGFNDIDTEGDFRWLNPIGTNGYTNWNRRGSHEPNGGRAENCVEIIPGKKYSIADWNGAWNDKGCTWRYPFICQKVIGKVDGGWSPWSAYTLCSKTCGMGQQKRFRTCSNPPPKRGGKICRGGMREEESKICILRDCP